MTEREAAIVAAYTCTQIGNFATTHAYIEEILGRPVMTHQMADQRVWDEIKDKSRADFLALKIVAADQEDTERKEWRCAPGEHDWQRFPQISDGIVCAKCGADQEDTDV